MTDFRALISLLIDARVEFIIVGGAAATAHGSARLTQDLDVVYRRTEENIGRLVQALAPYSKRFWKSKESKVESASLI